MCVSPDSLYKQQANCVTVSVSSQSHLLCGIRLNRLWLRMLNGVFLGGGVSEFVKETLRKITFKKKRLSSVQPGWLEFGQISGRKAPQSPSWVFIIHTCEAEPLELGNSTVTLTRRVISVCEQKLANFFFPA